MKKRYLLLLFIISLCLIQIGCKDKNKPEPQANTIGVRFYIDEKLIHEYSADDESSVTIPDLKIPNGYVVIRWDKSLSKEQGKIFYNYNLVYSIKQCSITFEVEGYETEVYTITYGSKLDMPDYRAPKGSYYKWNLDLSVLESVTEDLVIKGTREEYDKQTMYYIDGVLVKDETTKYSIVPNEPEIPNKVKTYKWIKTEEFSNNKFIITMNLEYTLKGGRIRYFDGNEELFLNPSSYVVGDDVIFPDYEKEGYEFIGWFASDSSLYCYTSIPESSEGSIILYARFVQTYNFTPFILPEATYHFTGVNKVPSGNNFIHQPIFPTLAPSMSVLDYDFVSSDNSVLSINTWSSMTGKKAGFSIITAVYKSDPSITINAVVRVTSEGIVFSSAEEANTHEFCKVTFLGKDDEIITEQIIEKGGSVIPPTPFEYDGYAFKGWNHELYGINANTMIKGKYEEGVNKYVGKKVAIIGDSISTFNGYIPEGYEYFYPYPTADLFDVNQTWWMQLINHLGAGLFVNNSYSGSCVSTGSSGTNTDSRLASTVINSECPDVIIIYMGSNDCASSFVNLADFRSQYKVMLDKLKKLCPKAEIILCTLPISKLYKTENKTSYNQVITSYATNYNLKLVDLGNIDISNNLVDSAHPNRSGHTIIEKAIYESLFKIEDDKIV